MKTFVKVIKLTLPVLAFAGITSSCKKQECCSWTYGGDTYKYCEDDASLAANGYTWEMVKAYAALYGGKCEKEKK